MIVCFLCRSEMVFNVLQRQRKRQIWLVWIGWNSTESFLDSWREVCSYPSGGILDIIKDSLG